MGLDYPRLPEGFREMGQKDVTGIAVDRVGSKVSRLRTRMAEKIPFGPLTEKLSPNELRQKLSKLDLQAKQSYMMQMGSVEWDKMMDEAFRR